MSTQYPNGPTYNVDNALRILNVPNEFKFMDGKHKWKVVHRIVAIEHYDFTKKNPVTGRSPLITSHYETRAEPANHNFEYLYSANTPEPINTGFFGLNHLSAQINSFDLDNIFQDGDGNYVCRKDRMEYESKGRPAWIGMQEMRLKETEEGFEINWLADPFENVESNPYLADGTKNPEWGWPEDTGGQNPLIKLLKISRTTRPGKPGLPPQTGEVRHNKSVSVRKLDIMEAMNWTEEDILWNTRSVIVGGMLDPTTNLVNESSDLEITPIDENSFKLREVAYYNGVDGRTFNFKALKRTLGASPRSTMTRYRFHNGNAAVRESIYGASGVIEVLPGQDNEITIVKSDHFAIDKATKTVHLDMNQEQCVIWAAHHEYPSKNGRTAGAESYYNVHMNAIVTDSRANIARADQ